MQDTEDGLRVGKFFLAGIVYAGFAVCLYYPYFRGFGSLRLRDLFVVNACAGALGCFVLSRRWVGAFWASLIAGAIYGFGPFAFGLAKFHPSAGVLAASIPWLFCPAAFGPKGRWRCLRVLLCAVPFLAVVLFFEVSAKFGLFPVPIQLKFKPSDLASLLAPVVVAGRVEALVGFYHVPIAALIMGFSMLLAGRRLGVVLIAAVGTILAFRSPVFAVSPIIWLAMPVLCCSVIIGAGMQGFASAGSADRKWVLAASVIMVVFSVVTLLLATKYFQVFAGLGAKYARGLVDTAKMYILGAVAAGVIFFIARAELRLAPLRWVILCSSTAVDIFLGARLLIGKVF